MNLTFNENQLNVADSARSLIHQLHVPTIIRELDYSQMIPNPDVWKRLADQGWFSLGIPEELGGIGYTVAEECALFREIGRHLVPGPILATVIGARLAAEAGDDELSASFASGQRRVALIDPRALTDSDGSAVSVNGSVIDGIGADYGLVVGQDLCVLAPLPNEGISIRHGIDPGSRLAHARFETVSVAAATTGQSARRLIARVQILLAAQLCGIAEATRDMSVEYTSSRIQFGRPIASFQAVSRRCADMAVRCEAALSQLLFGALRLDTSDDYDFQANAAVAIAIDAALRNSADNMQNHGAIGMTYEHDAHLYLTRARVLNESIGSKHAIMRQILELDGPILEASK